MSNIDITNGPSGSLNASGDPNLMSVSDESITVTNLASCDVFIFQMTCQPWAQNASSAPLYAYLATVKSMKVLIPPIVVSDYKVYLGFACVPADETAATSADAQTFFNAQNIPSDDSWFLSPPVGGPVVPMRIAGCIDTVLSPQTATDPLHSDHPAIAVTMGVWDLNNATMWINNSSGQDVTFYVQLSYNDGTPTALFAYPLAYRLSAYTFPLGGNVAKVANNASYGFAFTGKFDTAQAYFTTHPSGADGHHTQDLPPPDASDTATA